MKRINTHRVAYWVMVTAIAALILLLVAVWVNPAWADDELVIDWDRQACMDIRVDRNAPNDVNATVLELTPGAYGGDVVGHYVWLQHAWNAPDPDSNNVSWDLTGDADGTIRTGLCTPYVVSGYLPEGAGAAYRVEGERVLPTGETVTISIVTTSATPHPSLADAWLTSNGWTIL